MTDRKRGTDKIVQGTAGIRGKINILNSNPVTGKIN
jgi:hypothetical protein